MLVSKRRNLAVLVIVFTLMIVVVFGAFAQAFRYPTYHYYGRILNADEFLQLIEEGTPLGCTPLPSVGTYLGDPTSSLDIICFHTDEELTSYIENVLDPQWEQIARENPIEGPERSVELEASEKPLSYYSANHWALYGGSYYTSPYLGDVHNGSGCRATSSGVWSAWRDGSPNNLSLYGNSTCSSNPYYTVSTALGSCGIQWPLYCGGSTSVSVP